MDNCEENGSEMKKTITMTREEWVTKYHGFADENEDVKQFLLDYFGTMCGTTPGNITIVGKLHEATVAWVCDGYEDIVDCFICVWWDADTDDSPDILIETYAWDKNMRTSVTVE